MKTIKDVNGKSTYSINQVTEYNISDGILMTVGYERGSLYYPASSLDVSNLQKRLIGSDDKTLFLDIKEKTVKEEKKILLIERIAEILEVFPNTVLSGLTTQELVWLKETAAKENIKFEIALDLKHLYKEYNSDNFQAADYIISHCGGYNIANNSIKLIRGGKKVILDWGRPDPNDVTSKTARVIGETNASSNLYIATSYPTMARQLVKNVINRE